jgi:hypothetical protein
VFSHAVEELLRIAGFCSNMSVQIGVFRASFRAFIATCGRLRQ